ncbi:MAG: ribonuclease Y, partial [Actinomycetota bacterium]|nr:ribonuclease Y [Actinomycetota bacterium]
SEQELELDSRETQVKEGEQAVALRLEESAGLSHEDALAQLLERVENESRAAALKRAVEVEEQVKEGAEQTAKNILSMAIQRYAGEYVCERTVSVVSLPSDELKGRIIGREGRNIRALEAATGVDFIIDDTPETIVISAFNPIRREVARSALETLLEDGRIHPTRIESVVRKAEVEFYKVLQLAGEEAAREVGVAGIHPEILKLVGALKYRTSYGQNQWQHALEVAFLCGSIAAELGLDETLARRAGLLHDIGKVMDQTSEGSHALIGAEFARGHGESAQVVNAIASHHEEVEQESIYAVLAQAADAISGARPGARSEMMRTYNQRLTDLERISNSFPGVQRSYAVQAGREIRVLVENARVSDEDAVALSRDIAHKIESEMAFPGQIKVTVIRETRIVQYAR